MSNVDKMKRGIEIYGIWTMTFIVWGMLTAGLIVPDYKYIYNTYRYYEREIYWLETTTEEITAEEYAEIVNEVAAYNGYVRGIKERSRSVWWGMLIDDAEADALQEIILPETTVKIAANKSPE